MGMSRPWRIIAGAGTAAAVLGLGATAVAASDGFDLQDRDDPIPVENVDLRSDDSGSAASAESPAESPFDDADSPTNDAESPVDSADSPTAGDGEQPDQPAPAPVDSPVSADSAASAASADSAD